MDSNIVLLTQLQERIGQVSKAADTSHSRIDKLDAEIKRELHEISADVKLLLANMNMQKGARGTWILVGSLAVALLGALAKIFLRGQV